MHEPHQATLADREAQIRETADMLSRAARELADEIDNGADWRDIDNAVISHIEKLCKRMRLHHEQYAALGGDIRTLYPRRWAELLPETPVRRRPQ